MFQSLAETDTCLLNCSHNSACTSLSKHERVPSTGTVLSHVICGTCVICVIPPALPSVLHNWKASCASCCQWRKGKSRMVTSLLNLKCGEIWALHSDGPLVVCFLSGEDRSHSCPSAETRWMNFDWTFAQNRSVRFQSTWGQHEGCEFSRECICTSLFGVYRFRIQVGILLCSNITFFRYLRSGRINSWDMSVRKLIQAKCIHSLFLWDLNSQYHGPCAFKTSGT